MKKKQQKFYIAKNTAIWSVISAIFMIIVSIIFIIMEQEIQSIPSEQYNWFQKNIPIFKEAVVLITSVIITTLLSTFLIEVRDKNSMFLEILGNDIITSKEFYEAVSDETKRNLLNTLESGMYFNNIQQKQIMHSSILKKMKCFPNDYYFESCRYDVKCNIQKDIIEKTIVRTIRARSYKKTLKIKDHVLVRSGMRKINGRDAFEMISVKINGNILSQGEISSVSNSKSSKVSYIRANYENVVEVRSKKDIDLHNDRDTIIEIEYKTIVPISDTAFICRTSRPCRNFEVNFSVVNSSCDYRLSAHAFGFADEAPTETMDHKDEKRIKFSEWIFESDGVIVYIEKEL